MAKTSSKMFFRTILNCHSKHGALELPQQFVKEHWESLSEHACLTVPTGEKSKLKMKMKKTSGRAWLCKGWQNFVKKYSIKKWYTLIFRYERRSNFFVHICDWSSQEIEYDTKEIEKDSDIEKAKNSALKDKEFDNDDCSTESDDDSEMEMDNYSDEGADDDCSKEIDKDRKSKSRQKSLSAENNIEREKAVRNPNPHFSVIMRPAYVTNRSSKAIYMRIPKDGASYFKKKRKGDIELSLKGRNGKVWTMKYYLGPPPNCLPRIGSGWRKFSVENNLKEGDKCTFELVSKTNMKFKVIISRKEDEQVQGTKDPTNEEETKKRQRISSLKKRSTVEECNDTSFTVTIKKSEVQYNPRLNIPRGHSKRYLHDQDMKEVELCWADGKTWCVKCHVYGVMARFYSGWKNFVVDNDLKVGDSCVFQLIHRKPNRYSVYL